MIRRCGFAIQVLIALAAAACHESEPEPEVTPAFGDAELALSCAENLTCDQGVCDPATLACVDCLGDGDCASGRCHPRDHVCVQCVGHADCGGPDDDDGRARGVCHPTRAVCVGCFDDSQCGERGVCHPERLACVECLADRDCGAGICNRDTFACVGQCATDSQCSDRNPCSDERCDGGVCKYAPVPDANVQGCDDGVACTTRDRCQGGRCRGEPTAACCEPLTCRPEQHPIDSDNDGCNDRCECVPASPCPLGTTPADPNLGGCNEACVCPNGAIIGPDGTCPCAVDIACDGGLVPSDLDGDGCPETCARPCQNACDCEAQGIEAKTPCPLACAQCGPFLECESGACVGRCGVAPPRECRCPEAPPCGQLETAYDSDGDGCNDSCKCLVDGPNGCACTTAVVCDEGSSAVDSDGDGCPDTCRCDDPTRVPRPDGSCCEKLECPPGQVPFNDDADRCPEACVCQTGDAPSFAPPVCPCRELICPEGSDFVDDDGDGCADRCECADGSAPGPGGCGGCLEVCGADLPPWMYFVDEDNDGCYDGTGECPVGATAARSPDAGCPDFCKPCPAIVCPQGAKPIDNDADRCPDLCVCENTANEAPPEGCGCAGEIVCQEHEVPIDSDHDGCADTCRTPCTNACDCGGAELVAACDCVDCSVARTCVDGFCSGTCHAQLAPCLAAADEPVCGCDEATYPSRCEAGKAGVDVAYAGVCGGCSTDSDCAPDERCERSTDACNVDVVVADASCVIVPTSCLDARDPVCGCDGKTYENDCERLRANVGRAGRGACLAAPADPAGND